MQAGCVEGDANGEEAPAFGGGGVDVLTAGVLARSRAGQGRQLGVQLLQPLDVLTELETARCCRTRAHGTVLPNRPYRAERTMSVKPGCNGHVKTATSKVVFASGEGSYGADLGTCLAAVGLPVADCGDDGVDGCGD